MTEYECPSCKKHKETINRLIDLHTELLCKKENELSGIEFDRQMNIVLETIKSMYPADPSGEYHIYISKPRDDDKIFIINDSEEIFRPREKITKFTIYYREFIE